MSNLKELIAQTEEQDPDIVLGKDLALIYDDAASQQEWQRDMLFGQADQTQFALDATLTKMTEDIREKRRKGSELDVAAMKNKFISEVATTAIERIGYPNELVQGVGRLSLRVLERVRGNNALIAKLFKQAHETDLIYFFHPDSPKALNVLTASDYSFRFTLGPIGTIAVSVFGEETGSDEISADFLMAQQNEFALDQRTFYMNRVNNRKSRWFQTAPRSMDNMKNIPLDQIDPAQFIESFGDRYTVINNAVQQMVAELS